MRQGLVWLPLVAVQPGATLAWLSDEAWGRAGGRGKEQVGGAERGTTYRPIHTSALVLAAGTETLPALVYPTAVLTRAALLRCCRETTGGAGERGDSSVSENIATINRKLPLAQSSV